MKPEKKFYEYYVPELIKQISKLVEVLEKQNKINEKLLLLEKRKILNESNKQTTS